MIRRIANYFSTIPEMWIDGTLYTLIALLTAMTATFSTDEAAKYISPAWLFWARSSVTWMLAGVGAVKMFRSTSFAEHQQRKENEQTPKTS